MIPLGIVASAWRYQGAFAYIGGVQLGGSTAKTKTVTDVPLGEDFNGRQLVIVVMAATSSANGDVSAVTVNGQPFALDATSGIQRSTVAVYRGAAPGALADITVTGGASTNALYGSSCLAVYTLPAGFVPIHTAGAGGTLGPLPIQADLAGVTIAGSVLLSTGAATGFAPPVQTDYNFAGHRLAGHVQGQGGTIDLVTSLDGNGAYNRIAGVTYA